MTLLDWIIVIGVLLPLFVVAAFKFGQASERRQQRYDSASRWAAMNRWDALWTPATKAIRRPDYDLDSLFGTVTVIPRYLNSDAPPHTPISPDSDVAQGDFDR